MNRLGQSLVLMLLTASLGGGPAALADEGVEFLRLLGSAKVSCATLMIAEYPKTVSYLQGPAIRVPFDESDCAKTIAETDSNKLLAPVVLMFPKQQDDYDWTTATKAERERRRAEGEAIRNRVQSSLQSNFASLFAACGALGDGHRPEHIRICYFGAPSAKSGAPFRIAFDAMVNNTLPDSKTLCAAEQESDWSKAEPEFQLLRDQFPHGFSWTSVRRSLEQDGFACDGEEKDRCTRLVLGVTPRPAEGGLEGAGLAKNALGAIIPRLLTVYKGDWRQIGPYRDRCFLNEKGGSVGDCKDKVAPTRGARSGICLEGEDWHIWARVVFLFNMTGDDEQ